MKPTLRLGVRKNGDGIDAHSWVEFNGRIVNDFDSVVNVFTTFQKWPASPGREASSGDNGKIQDHSN